MYGSYRIKKALERENIYYSRAYIAVWMQKMGLKSVLRRKYVITTNSNHSYPIAENKLNREFTSYQLGEKWVSDITYVRVNDNWNYLTTIMDLADRKIVGWQLSEDMTVENTIYKAWIKARENRNISDNFIFHSDRGVQYASKRMTCIFSFNRKITQSMSRKGNCWDNAVAESFFKTIENECLNRYSFSSILSLYRCIDEYINWYNTERLHSSLGYKTPLEMEIYLNVIATTSKIAEALGVTIDYLVKDGVYEQIDKETLSRLKEIQNLDEETKKHIFATIDAFIAKTKIQSILK